MTRSPFLAPKGFRPADLVVAAEFCDGPSFATGERLKGSAARGMRYERQVHRHFAQLFPAQEGAPFYVPSRWIRFNTPDPRERGYRYAQPDGLIVDFDRKLIILVETKLSHTVSAWWQLRRLYEPLIRKIFGARWSVAVCEVCRWYDPGVAWPEPFTLVRSPAQLHPSEFGVHILSAMGMIRQEALASAALVHFPVGTGAFT